MAPKRKATPTSAGPNPATGKTGGDGKGGGCTSVRRASPDNELDLMAMVTSPGAAQVLLSLSGAGKGTPQPSPPGTGGTTGGSTGSDGKKSGVGKGTGAKGAGSNSSAGKATKRKRGDEDENEDDKDDEESSGRLNTDYKNDAVRAIVYFACK